MSANSKYLISIVGPTAVGKTDLAIHFANLYSAEIISADSRQVFKEMRIGTAKPSQSDLSKARHHFIDSHSIKDEFSAGEFEREALSLLDKIFLDNNVAFLVGGSGLYINALLYGLPNMPKILQKDRENVNAELLKYGLEKLIEELKTVDPDYYYDVDLSNPQRVTRAIEIYRGTGKPFSYYRLNKKEKRSFKNIVIGLERNREQLYGRINSRVDQMIDDGLLDEVKSLTDYKSKQALQTVGYKEIISFLEGEISFEESVELVKRNSRRYAKRQMTWFRKNDDIKWFHPDQLSDIDIYIRSKINT